MEAKKLIVRLAACILTQFEGVELIDKYDVYQVLLAYWLEVMSDDVYVVIHDGYEAGRELSYEYVVKTHKEGDETITEVTDKVKSWDGKLIPKRILIDTYFPEEQKAIDDIAAILADLQMQADEFAEEQSAEDGVLSDCCNAKEKLDPKLIAAKLKKLRSEAPHSEEYALLKQYSDLIAKIKEKNKLLRTMVSLLEQKLKAKYAALTVEEIQELLVSKKWYCSIRDGIDGLYGAVSHTITDRVVELAERYEEPLPALSGLVEDYEAKVRSHLERMGFAW